jgi:hypothetical protein
MAVSRPNAASALLVIALTLAALPGCSDPPALEIGELRPNAAGPAQPTPVEIHGSGFLALPRANYDDPSKAITDTTFQLTLGSHTLQSVSYHGKALLKAVVPAGLSPGRYTLSVRRPDGRTGRLVDAFTVLGATDAGPEDLGPDSSSDGSVDASDGSVDASDDGVDAADARMDTVVDLCPQDPNKTAPGKCGCGVFESDIDNHGSCEPWTQASWSFRRPLIIGSRAPATTHSGFPVLIDIRNDTSLRDHARADGHDVRFTTESGIALEHETERYDPATGSLRAWVKLPSLDTSGDTLVLLYYGDASAGADPSVTTVWSNAYSAVWHLGEAGAGVAGEYVDASGNGRHGQGGGGVQTATPTRVVGKIGYAQDGDGVDDVITTSLKLAGESSLTVSAWFRVRRTDNIARPGLLGQNDALEIGFYWSDRINVWTPSVTTPCPGKGTASACTASFTLNAWMQLAIVFDGTNVTLYVDGVQRHVAAAPTVGSSPALFSLLGNVFNASGNHLDGTLDEVRVASTARSAAWIVDQHVSQSDPSSFYRLEPVQSAP